MLRISNDGPRLASGARETRLRELLVSGLAGDPIAYHTFLTELAAHLRSFLRKRLAALPDDVEDVVQESLLAVHLKRHTYDPAQPLTAWVHAIARYKLVDFLRRHGSRGLVTTSLDDDIEPLSGSDMDAAEARRDVRELLEQLPDRQRLPIIRVKLEGLSVTEAARVTGMSESAIKVGVHRGLKALAAKMQAG
jgi:RNA polymerase sigma-70 factor (ECF subfamily)